MLELMCGVPSIALHVISSLMPTDAVLNGGIGIVAWPEIPVAVAVEHQSMLASCSMYAVLSCQLIGSCTNGLANYAGAGLWHKSSDIDALQIQVVCLQPAVGICCQA